MGIRTRTTVDILPYDRSLVIRNTDSLPRGTGARFLECLTTHRTGELVAAAWRRKAPATLAVGRVLVDFKPGS